MIKTGSIIAMIAGLLGVFAGFVTLFLGGMGSAFSASGFGEIVSLGWGGILFSLLTIIYGGIALSNRQAGVTGLILSAILGIVLGGTLVATLMVLSLIGGIMVAVGKPKNVKSQSQNRWLGIAIAAIAPVVCAVFIGGKLVGTDGISNKISSAAGPILQIGQTARSEKFEVTVLRLHFAEMLGQGLAETRADPGTVFAVIEVAVRCVDNESRYYNSGDLYAEVNGAALKYDHSEVILGLDSPNGMINPLTEKIGFMVYKIPREAATSILSWTPGVGFSDLRFALVSQESAQTATADTRVINTKFDSENYTGRYVSPNLGALIIHQQQSGEVGFALEVVSSEGNTGEAAGILFQEDNQLTYKDADTDCLLTISPNIESMEIHQEGSCGFGIGVIADGHYLKQIQS